ncbi:MAG TPA: DUF2147 domain-containing protein [Vulgatibacter sp.]
MRLFLAAGLSALVFASAASASEPSVVGRWQTVDDETGKPKAIVVIQEENGKLSGRIERLFRAPDEEQDPRCDKCSGPLEGKPIIGMVILRDLERDGDEWTGGTILDPANGKTYSCKIALEDGGKKLKVRGYLGISLLGRTQRWIRAE